MSCAWLIAALIGSVGVSYGPGVHVREADMFADAYTEWSSPEMRAFVRLGSVFPDLRSGGVLLPLNSHDKALGDAMLEIAEGEGVAWKAAFAHGYRLHTLSDTQAHLRYLPWLNASSDLQQVNLFGRDDLGALGDNELFIEGYGDIHSGDLPGFMETLYTFVMEEPGQLDAVLDFFVSVIASHVREPFDVLALRAGVAGFWASIRETLDGLDPDFVEMLLSGANTLSVSEVIGLLSSGIFADLLGSVPGASGNLVPEPYEMTRLEAHPIGHSPEGFFQAYEDHFHLATLDVLEGAGYAGWPWYRDMPIAASIVQGFALARPDIWSHQPELLLWDAAFVDATGGAMSVIEASASGSVRARSEWYLAFEGEPLEVVMEIVALEGASITELGAKPALASSSGLVGYGSERTTIDVELPLEEVELAEGGLALRWRVAGEELPFLETDWARYALWADAPLFRIPYEVKLASILPTLEVVGGSQAQDTWVQGHVVVPEGHRGISAVVKSSDGHESMSHAGGGFVLGGLPLGSISLSALAPGYRGGPLEIELVAGKMTKARIDMRSVPLVVLSPWSPTADSVKVELDLSHFPEVPEYVDLRVVSDEDAEEVALWRGGPSDTPHVVTFAQAQGDGARLKVYVRAAGGEEVEAAEFAVDSSPPEALTLSRESGECGGVLELALSAQDVHAPLRAFELRAGSGDWVLVAPDGYVSVESGEALSGSGALDVSVRAQNAAGLWSPDEVFELCPALESGVDASRDNVELPPAVQRQREIGPSDQVELERASPEGEGQSASEAGCSSTSPRPQGPWLWLLVFASLTQGHWPRRRSL